MSKSIFLSEKQKNFLDYLIHFSKENRNMMPSIQVMSEDLGISVASLREQMELAKNLGLVTAQPKKGVEIMPYRFSPAVSKSLYYAVNLDYKNFLQYSEVRNHLEKSFFLESVHSLDFKDLKYIQCLIEQAFNKLGGNPIQIPHEEHRNYHLAYYSRQKNIFLTGILEAYWDIYELVGLSLYTDLDYLNSVWDFHSAILQNVMDGNLDKAHDLLVVHMDFIYKRV